MRSKDELLLYSICVVSSFSCSSAETFSQSGGQNKNAAMYRELEDMDENISSQSITDGDFRDIRIGSTKQQVINRLKALEIDFVRPVVRNRIIVTRAKDLHRLKQAEGIIWFPGYVRIDFAGDDVTAREIDPQLDRELQDELRNAKNRDQVLIVFSKILDKNSRAEVGNYIPNSHWVRINEMPPTDMVLLEGTDTWEFGYSNVEGYWNIRTEFSASRLSKIDIQHSTVELP